jgi:hypothetical protein
MSHPAAETPTGFLFRRSISHRDLGSALRVLRALCGSAVSPR